MFPRIVFCLCLQLFICEVFSADTKVALKLGTIQGFRQKIEENNVNVFLGIPYAVPPIGDLRFKKPQPITENWSQPFDATKWPHICMQEVNFFDFFSEPSEDCLYLNVWTPVNLDEDFTQNLKPVMVFIHGGGWIFQGSSYKHHNASFLASFGDVVVVTLNYRLGAFGFLTSGNSDVPGNAALYDQALALEWVQENIAYFGGDPKKVTLFGESAGAWSALMQFLSPVSQNNFNKVIIMSGATFRGDYLDTKNESLSITKALAKYLNCPVDKEGNEISETTMKCLRKKDAKTITETQLKLELRMMSTSLINFSFRPIVGEAFLPKHPRKMMEEGFMHKDVPILVGTMGNEGYEMHWGMDLYNSLPKGENWKESLRKIIQMFFYGISDEIIEEAISPYFTGIDDLKSDEAKMSYYIALGDVFFDCETKDMCEALSKTNTLYQYLLDYPLVNHEDNVSPCDLNTACHANDLPITFGTVSHPKDIEVSKEWMKILTDFAKTGKVDWPKYGPNASAYYHFTGNKSNDRILYDFRSDGCKLWREILENKAA